MTFNFDYDGLDADTRARFFPPREDGKVNNRLWSATWSTMAVGIGQVTRLNYREFYMRLRIWNEVIGSTHNEVIDDELVPILLSLEECEALVGLRTNVSPETRSQFNAKLWNIVDQDTKRPSVPMQMVGCTIIFD